MLSVIILSVVMLSVIMLCVIMLYVIILSVVAPILLRWITSGQSYDGPTNQERTDNPIRRER
jgi:hypothetical protein